MMKGMIRKAKVTVIFEVEGVELDDLDLVCKTLASNGARGSKPERNPKVVSIQAEAHQVFDIEP